MTARQHSTASRQSFIHSFSLKHKIRQELLQGAPRDFIAGSAVDYGHLAEETDLAQMTRCSEQRSLSSCSLPAIMIVSISEDIVPQEPDMQENFFKQSSKNHPLKHLHTLYFVDKKLIANVGSLRTQMSCDKARLKLQQACWHTNGSRLTAKRPGERWRS